MNKTKAVTFLKDNPLHISDAIKIIENYDTDGKMSQVVKKQSLKLRKIELMGVLHNLQGEEERKARKDREAIEKISELTGLADKKKELAKQDDDGFEEDKIEEKAIESVAKDFDLRLYERTKFLAINVLRDFTN